MSNNAAIGSTIKYTFKVMRAFTEGKVGRAHAGEAEEGWYTRKDLVVVYMIFFMSFVLLLVGLILLFFHPKESCLGGALITGVQDIG